MEMMAPEELPRASRGGSVLDAEAVRTYLARYGFSAMTDSNWEAFPDHVMSAPLLEIQVAGHEEREGHTWYQLVCSLLHGGGAVGSRNLQWRGYWRLAQLREGLHNPVRELLSHDAYMKIFHGAPFALRGGPRGTTRRLRGWCGALSSCINQQLCPPSIVWLSLRFLEVPEPRSLTGDVKSSASTAAGALRGMLGTIGDSMKHRVEQAQSQAAESASSSAAAFAARNPRTARAAAGSTMGQFGAKATFSCAKQNPQAAFGIMKASARAAAAAF
mmetsp:Transcript_98955/g.191121  ORF Transcript_98955/g.191121 Transcript_98955/m.191121 type:complete len:273 (+) Transcript_98955:82-900(+)